MRILVASASLHGSTAQIADAIPALFTQAVWVFSSGPVGGPRPVLEPIEAAEMAGLAEAREHRVFDGCRHRSQPRWYERALATAIHAPDGEFRDWSRGIAAWLRTHEITRPGHTLEQR